MSTEQHPSPEAGRSIALHTTSKQYESTLDPEVDAPSSQVEESETEHEVSKQHHGALDLGQNATTVFRDQPVIYTGPVTYNQNVAYNNHVTYLQPVTHTGSVQYWQRYQGQKKTIEKPKVLKPQLPIQPRSNNRPSLPLEIWLQILEACQTTTIDGESEPDTDTLANLCRTCKYFHGHATPILYRIVAMTNRRSKKVSSLLAILLTRPGLRNHVERLDIQLQFNKQFSSVPDHPIPSEKSIHQCMESAACLVDDMPLLYSSFWTRLNSNEWRAQMGLLLCMLPKVQFLNLIPQSRDAFAADDGAADLWLPNSRMWLVNEHDRSMVMNILAAKAFNWNSDWLQMILPVLHTVRVQSYEHFDPQSYTKTRASRMDLDAFRVLSRLPGLKTLCLDHVQSLFQHPRRPLNLIYPASLTRIEITNVGFAGQWIPELIKPCSRLEDLCVRWAVSKYGITNVWSSGQIRWISELSRELQKHKSWLRRLVIDPVSQSEYDWDLQCPDYIGSFKDFEVLEVLELDDRVLFDKYTEADYWHEECTRGSEDELISTTDCMASKLKDILPTVLASFTFHCTLSPAALESTLQALATDVPQTLNHIDLTFRQYQSGAGWKQQPDFGSERYAKQRLPIEMLDDLIDENRWLVNHPGWHDALYCDYPPNRGHLTVGFQCHDLRLPSLLQQDFAELNLEGSRVAEDSESQAHIDCGERGLAEPHQDQPTATSEQSHAH